MASRLSAFLTGESGVSAVEYGLIAAFVSAAGVVVLEAIGVSLAGIFTATGAQLK